MKYKFPVLIITLLLCHFSFAQRNQLRMVYNLTTQSVLHPLVNLRGDNSPEVDRINSFGVRYLRNLSNGFSLETGLGFVFAELKQYPYMPIKHSSTESGVKTGNLGIVTVPIFVNYSFWKYFFIHGGPMINIQHTGFTNDNQTGIGALLGVGLQYNFNNFLIYASPNMSFHTLVPLAETERYHDKLIQQGFQFGFGYSF